MKHFTSKEKNEILRNGAELFFTSYDPEFGFQFKYKVNVAEHPDFCEKAMKNPDDYDRFGPHHYELSDDRKSIIFVRHGVTPFGYECEPPKYYKEHHYENLWFHGALTEEELSELGIEIPNYILVQDNLNYSYFHCFDVKNNIKATFKEGHFATALYRKGGRDYTPDKSLIDKMKNFILKTKENII